MITNFHLYFSQSPDLLFEIITDVSKYHEFVPFCVRCEVLPSIEDCTSSDDDPWIFLAEMTVGFQRFNDSYKSKVTVSGKRKIEVEAIEAAMFNHLKSVWQISEIENGKSLVEFLVDFEFNSYIYAYAANIFFISVSKEMVVAFKNRAISLAEKRAHPPVSAVVIN